MIDLDLPASELLDLADEATRTLSNFPAIASDVRLATYRSVTTTDPSSRKRVLERFPSLRKDPRFPRSRKPSQASTRLQVREDDGIDDLLGEARPFEDADVQEVLVALFDDANRLNDVRDAIQFNILEHGIEASFIAYCETLNWLLESMPIKTARKFYVAALRELGEADNDAGIEFGGRFDERMEDLRGTRSYVIFLTRGDQNGEAIKLITTRFSDEDEWASNILVRLREREEVRMLEATFSTNLDQFADEGDAELRDFMDEAYEQTERPGELASVFFRYSHSRWKSERTQFNSEQVIRWGTALLGLVGLNNTVAIHVSNAHVTLGDIQSALAVLQQHGSDGNEKIEAKRTGYASLLHLSEHGYTPVDIGHAPTKLYDAYPRRILYLLHNSLPFNSGGYAARAHGLMKGVAALGWDVHVVTRAGYPHDRGIQPDEGHPATEVIDGITYHRMYELEEGYGQVNLLRYLEVYQRALVKKVEELRPSILHAASNHLNGLIGNSVAAWYGIPSVYEVRGLWEITRISRQPEFEGSEYFRMMVALETQACAESTSCLAITQGLIQEINGRLDLPRDIGYLPNGVEVERFSPRKPDTELRRKLGYTPDEVVVGYIGSVVSYEGLDLLMEALPLVRARASKPFKVLLVGDGAYMDEVEEACKEAEVEDLVYFAGRVPHEEVEAYYSLVDIAPFPRLPQPVTELVSPLKPFEAMAMEKAVIASDVHALTEIVQHQETGLLFGKGNAESLADALHTLIEDASLRENLGRQARKWVEEERDWRAISKTLDATYSNLLR